MNNNDLNKTLTYKLNKNFDMHTKILKNEIMVICEKTNYEPSDIIFSLERFLQVYNNMLNDISKVHIVCSYDIRGIKRIKIPGNIVLHRAGVWRERKGYIRLFFHLIYFFRIIKTSNDLLKKNQNISVIMNLMNHQTIGLIAIFLSKLSGRKSLVRITNEISINHGFTKKFRLLKLFYKVVMQRMERFILDEADVLISVSPLILKKYPQYKNKIFLIHGSTPALEAYCHNKIIKKTVGKYFHILFVGRLEPIKGVDILLDALVGLRDVKCVIVGKGSMEDRLKERILELQLQDTVMLCGLLHQKKVFKLMEKSDLLVLPSYSEYSPNVLIEAAAIGTPIIASAIQGNKSLIKHGKTGLLFRKGDAKDLQKKISFIQENPKVREILRKAAKEEICTIYSPIIKRRKVENLFKLLYNE